MKKQLTLVLAVALAAGLSAPGAADARKIRVTKRQKKCIKKAKRIRNKRKRKRRIMMCLGFTKTTQALKCLFAAKSAKKLRRCLHGAKRGLRRCVQAAVSKKGKARRKAIVRCVVKKKLRKRPRRRRK